MSMIRASGAIPTITALHIATASLAVPKSVMKTIVACDGFCDSSWPERVPQPASEQTNKSTEILSARQSWNCVLRSESGYFLRPEANVPDCSVKVLIIIRLSICKICIASVRDPPNAHVEELILDRPSDQPNRGQLCPQRFQPPRVRAY